MTVGSEIGQGSHESGKDIPPWLQPVPETENLDGSASSKKLLIAMIAGAVVVISLFVAVIIYLYEGSNNLPPIRVAAPSGPVKEKPIDAGGMEINHQDKEIFNQADGIKPRGDVALGALPETPVENVPDDPVGDAIAALEAKEPEATDHTQTNTRPVVRPSSPDEPASIEKPVAAASPPQDEQKTNEAVTATTQTGVYRIQLGAYGSEASAQRAWRNVRNRFSASLKGKAANFEAVNTGDRTLYRLRVGTYTDRASADQACLTLRASDQVCIVVNP